MSEPKQYKSVNVFFYIEHEGLKRYRVFARNAWGVVIYQHWFAGIRKTACKRIAERKFWKKVLEDDYTITKEISRKV